MVRSLLRWEIAQYRESSKVKVEGGFRSIYPFFGIVFLILQVLLVRMLMSGSCGGSVATVALCVEVFFSLVLYVIASWFPFWFCFEMDEQRGEFSFAAIPRLLKKRRFRTTEITGLVVDRRPEFMAYLYVVAEKPRRIFMGYEDLVEDMARKAASAFNMPLEFR